MANDLVARCLKRIRERDAEVRAWVAVEPQPALGGGPLAGLPFGAKDIFDTQAMCTECGSPVFAGRRAGRDAGLVKLLRERGAILLGKTHTTAFAYFDPAPTCNPRNLRHTPGGSSSGSAAAVADRMVPFALGTQTQGSVLRPASFCGIAGFKPGHGVLPMEGVQPFAPSLDTAGLFTPTAADMRLLWERVGFRTSGMKTLRLAAFPAPVEVEQPMRRAFESAVQRLGADWVDPPDTFWALPGVVRCVNDYEGSRTLGALYRQHGARMGEKLAELIERGLALPDEEYLAAQARREAAGRDIAQVFSQYSVVLTPAALGPAPEGLASTGDPRMNSPWTGLGVPAISVPMPAGGGLPLGLQMASAAGEEASLLDAACIVENEFAAQ